MIIVSRIEHNNTWHVRIEFPTTTISTSVNMCGLNCRYESWTYDDNQRSRAIAHYRNLIDRNYSWT